MKRYPLYRPKMPGFPAMRFTDDTTPADLHDFCGGLVQDATENVIRVYDEETQQWWSVKRGDWIVENHGLHPISHEEFVDVFEEVSDVPEP